MQMTAGFWNCRLGPRDGFQVNHNLQLEIRVIFSRVDPETCEPRGRDILEEGLVARSRVVSWHLMISGSTFVFWDKIWAGHAVVVG